MDMLEEIREAEKAAALRRESAAEKAKKAAEARIAQAGVQSEKALTDAENTAKSMLDTAKNDAAAEHDRVIVKGRELDAAMSDMASARIGAAADSVFAKIISVSVS